MISFLKGTVAAKGASGAIVEVGGVGYELAMSAKAVAALPDPGGGVQVWTCLRVKDDAMSLFGFSQLAEREMFERLVGVKGLGPKLALSMLSSFTPDELACLIGAQDDAGIARAPGVGKKTAQRIVLELKDVFKEQAPLLPADGVEPAESLEGPLAEARSALCGMGFSDAEATRALAGCPDAADVAAAIRYALKTLGGSR